jgi:hypothetical protein
MPHFFCMKVLSVEDAETHFTAICEEAMAGEVIRLRLASGGLLELTPVMPNPTVAPISDQVLANCYVDEDWAAFENHCGKASD